VESSLPFVICKLAKTSWFFCGSHDLRWLLRMRICVFSCG